MFARATLLACTLLLMLALSGAQRDLTPPNLYIEVEGRVPAGLPFDLLVSADEPVTYLVSYGELELEQVAQDLKASLLALSGSHELQVSAVDAGGNERRIAAEVLGVPEVFPRLEAPERVTAGEAFTVTASWQAAEAEVVDATLAVGGKPGPVLRDDDRLTVLSAAPLGSVDSAWPVTATLVDEFGRRFDSEQALRVESSALPVQELNVPATTLSVITPEGRELERKAFEEAFASQAGRPLWEEPFVEPIAGRSTSGFGLPRRYAPGGPVSYHEGSDIAAPEGTPIAATNSGVVRVAGFFPIKGGLTIIDHGAGVSSLYFHQSRIDVVAGDSVERGQTIGAVGSTGLSTGPHLHWEMRVAEVPTNPMAWVGRVWP